MIRLPRLARSRIPSTATLGLIQTRAPPANFSIASSALLLLAFPTTPSAPARQPTRTVRYPFSTTTSIKAETRTMSSGTSKPHIILITGANTGIGLETVRALAKSPEPYTIILGGRTPSKIDSAIAGLRKEIPHTKSTFESVQVDVTSDQSIKDAHASVKERFGYLDTLINNAGASFDYDLASGKIGMRSAWNQAWDVNVAGTYILTYEFAGLLVASPNTARLLFLTSGTASIAETFPDVGGMTHLTKAPGKGWPKADMGFDVTAYRSAKVGLNMMMRQWERILREDGVKVFAISPGFLATGLGNMGDEGKERLRQMGAKEPHLGGEFIRDVVQGKRDENAGLAIRSDKVQPW